MPTPYTSRIILSPGGFSEASFTSSPESLALEEWGDFGRRRNRYGLYWAHFENNVYRRVHRWGLALKEQYGLYAYTRSIYSPANRIVEFWTQHLMGGPLDRDAGDGKAVTSALPILTDNELLRPAISQIWSESVWQRNKDTFARFGATMGDVGLMVVDDEAKARTYLKVIHPGTIKELDRDSRGNVKGYVIQETRIDPRVDTTLLASMPLVTYTEVASREGEAVVFETYLDDTPHDWRDYGGDPNPPFVPQWTESYGFIPLVFVQHRDMGLGWGWSELHAILSKLYELDDMASKLDDQIRKIVECPLAFSGVVPGADGGGITIAGDEESTTDPEPGRAEVPVVYLHNENARPHQLLAPLDIKAVSDHIKTLQSSIEEDHPELLADNVGLAASGAARRIAREKVEAMVIACRPGYDEGLTRAHKMAVHIGAMKGYPGFEGFNEGSYERGELEHSIDGSRPVFTVDDLDRIEVSQARANALKVFRDSGMSLGDALIEVGYTEEQARKIAASAEADATRAMERQSEGLRRRFAGEDLASEGVPQ